MREKLRTALLALLTILFVWFIAEGSLVEEIWTTGWAGRTIGGLLKHALPNLLIVVLVLSALVLLANSDCLFQIAFHALSVFLGHSGEDRRLREYRKSILLKNFVGNLRVFCGGVALLALLVQALVALSSGTAGGLFAGGALENAVRFGKFAFFLACLWGLFPLWRDYSNENAKQCLLRKDKLAQMEDDPDWWRKMDEEQQQRKTDQAEWERKLIEMAFDLNASPEREALQRSQESLANLTHQIRDAREQKKKF